MKPTALTYPKSPAPNGIKKYRLSQVFVAAFLYLEINMSLCLHANFSQKGKYIFSKKYTADSCDLLCLSRILQSAKVYPYEVRRPYRLFVHLLIRQVYIMSCALLDCQRRCFCVEFQASTCNIIYKTAVFRDARKGCVGVFRIRNILRR